MQLVMTAASSRVSAPVAPSTSVEEESARRDKKSTEEALKTMMKMQSEARIRSDALECHQDPQFTI